MSPPLWWSSQSGTKWSLSEDKEPLTALKELMRKQIVSHRSWTEWDPDLSQISSSLMHFIFLQKVFLKSWK